MALTNNQGNIKRTVSVMLLSAFCLSTSFCAYAQSTNFNSDFPDYTPPPVITPPPPPPPVITPPPPPPPVVTPPPPPPPVIQPQVVLPNFQSLMPLDVTNIKVAPVALPRLISAIGGVQALPDTRFPQASSLKGSADWILVRGDDDSHFLRPSPYSAKLEAGTIIVSVRRPSNVGLIQTPFGEIALNADADLMIKFDGSVLRVFNISARGSGCKIKFNDDIFNNNGNHTVALAPGFELVASGEPISKRDMRPTDGIARRKSQLLAGGKLAISEFSVESALSNSAIIASLTNKESDVKEKRILGDMSKMAAVLNYVNGNYGYTAEGASGIAQTPGSGTK